MSENKTAIAQRKIGLKTRKRFVQRMIVLNAVLLFVLK